MRLDHFLARTLSISERAAKVEVASGRVKVGGEMVKNHLLEVGVFTDVCCGGDVVQQALIRRYLMMNKPKGYVSATSDAHMPTVLDLIDLPDKDSLHLAGRLDRSSTGLLLITNDSTWSEHLSHPDFKVPKVYLVETVDPIPDSAVGEFADGFYFAHEGITTQPAELQILSPRKARVTIHEGKYHQVKRMFHRVNENRLVSLHRESIGDYELPDDLCPGNWVAIER